MANSVKRTAEQIDAEIRQRLVRADNISCVLFNRLHSYSSTDGNVAYSLVLNKIYDEIKEAEDKNVE